MGKGEKLHNDSKSYIKSLGPTKDDLYDSNDFLDNTHFNRKLGSQDLKYKAQYKSDNLDIDIINLNDEK